jgi:hypothetical protein
MRIFTMRVSIRVAGSLAACTLTLAACSGPTPLDEMGLPPKPKDTGGPAPVGNVSYQPPFLPFVISLDTNGSIRVATQAKIVTPLGAVTLGAGFVTSLVDNKPLPPRPADVTQLIVCPLGGNGTHCEAYQIDTGRKMRIEMDGRFIEEVEHNRVKIEAATGSTIKVIDIGPPSKLESHPAARIDVEGIHYYDTSGDTDVDLERSRSGTRNDLSYDHITGEMKPINGAQISQVKTDGFWSTLDGSDVPSENECLNTPANEWQDRFSADDLEDGDNVIVCIKTAEGDVGYLVIQVDGTRKPVRYEIYSYVWVR